MRVDCCLFVVAVVGLLRVVLCLLLVVACVLFVVCFCLFVAWRVLLFRCYVLGGVCCLLRDDVLFVVDCLY